MLLLVPLLLACQSSDGPGPGHVSTEPTPAVSDTADGDTASTDSTSPEGSPPLALRVEAPEQAPGVLHLVSGTGATDWAVQVAGGELLPAGSDGIVALVGYPQGSVVDVRVVREGEEEDGQALSLPIAPHARPWTVEVLDAERSEVDDGLIAVGLVGREGIEPEVLVLRGSDGDVLWWHPVDGAWDVSVATPNAEGDGLVWLENDATRTTDEARVVELSLDGRRYAIADSPTAHHVGVESGPGRYAFLSFEVRPDEVAPGGDTFDPASDRIMEMGPGGSNPTVVYSVMTQLLGGRFEWPCEHSATREDAYGHDAFVQWTHGNSLHYEPEDDTYVVYLRWIDTLLKVGRDGQLRWALSGPYSDFTAPDGSSLWNGHDDSPLWSHGHFTDAWPGGVLMYDNGSHTDEARVVEVHYDETDWTAEVVAAWYPPSEGEHHVLGDARRLPGGNVLVSWTVLGLMQEQTPAGEVVWEARGDPGVWFNRVRFASDLDALVAGPE